MSITQTSETFEKEESSSESQPESERDLRARISALEEQLAIRNSEYHMLSAEALATTQKLEQQISVLEQEKANLIREVYEADDTEILKETIHDLNEELIDANNELLEVHDQQESIRKTQLLEEDGLVASLDADVPSDELDEEKKSKIEELTQDIELMRSAMAQEDDRRLEDKDDLNMLRDENEELKEKILLLEDQIGTIKQLFNGISNICVGAGERLESLLQNGERIQMSMGESHFEWK